MLLSGGGEYLTDLRQIQASYKPLAEIGDSQAQYLVGAMQSITNRMTS
mgnify:CR=1 FL=1